MGLGYMGKEAGANLVITQPISVGTRDFSPILLKFKAIGIDHLVAFLPQADAITFLRQIDEMNL